MALGYRWPGLVQALRPGDVFFRPEYTTPTGSAGLCNAGETYLCVWRLDHRPKEPTHPDDAPTNYLIEVGALVLGRGALEVLVLKRFEAIEFPWNVHRSA